RTATGHASRSVFRGFVLPGSVRPGRPAQRPPAPGQPDRRTSRRALQAPLRRFGGWLGGSDACLAPGGPGVGHDGQAIMSVFRLLATGLSEWVLRNVIKSARSVPRGMPAKLILVPGTVPRGLVR